VVSAGPATLWLTAPNHPRTNPSVPTVEASTKHFGRDAPPTKNSYPEPVAPLTNTNKPKIKKPATSKPKIATATSQYVTTNPKPTANSLQPNRKDPSSPIRDSLHGICNPKTPTHLSANQTETQGYKPPQPRNPSRPHQRIQPPQPTQPTSSQLPVKSWPSSVKCVARSDPSLS